MIHSMPEPTPSPDRRLRPTRSPVPTSASHPWRRPTEPDVVSDRLDCLIHEVAGLVDGSMRHINLALRSVDEGTQLRGDSEALANRLKTVQHALGKMADALRNASGGPPMHWVQAAFAASLDDAIRYAVGIMQPIAADHSISIETDLDPRFRELPPGHLYTVLVNALRNSIESIIASRLSGGIIRINASLNRPTPDAACEWVTITISDTGIGPPALAKGHEDFVFSPEFSSKPGGLGIGLSISQQIINAQNGRIALTKGPRGVGATLRIEYPVPSQPANGPVN